MPYGPYIRLLVAGILVAFSGWAWTSYDLRSIQDEAVYMKPAVKKGNFALLSVARGMPARGDIVWFDPPGRGGGPLCARVVGLGGDTVALDDGVVVLNGRKVAEPYAQGKHEFLDLDPVSVPVDHLFVLNDARQPKDAARKDSRRLGPIPIVQLLGRTAGGPEAAELRAGARP